MTLLPEPGPVLATAAFAALFEGQLATLGPVTIAVSRALRRLDAILERRGWDAPATLWTVRRRDAPGPAAPVKVTLEQIDTGTALADEHPPDALSRLAAYPGRFLPSPHALVGIVFASEAWAATTDDQGAAQRAMQEASDRRLHLRETKTEVRSLACVTPDGVLLSHMMGSDPARFGRVESVSAPGMPALGIAMEGTVADSLRFLMARAHAGK